MKSQAIFVSLALNLLLLGVYLSRSGDASTLALSRVGGVHSTAPSRVAACAKIDGSLGRRAVVGGIGLTAPLMAVRRSMALLPDDDDAELLERAKSKRAERIKREKEVEYEFLRQQGQTNLKERTELVPITRAVARLADLGKAISEKNIIDASTSLSPDKGATGGWIKPLMDKVNELSDTDAKKSSGAALQAAFDDMSKASSAKDLPGLKRGYVSTVTALEKWATDANVAQFLRAQ
eukprot:CAMPEP_0184487132 /NCGR_PEP_ID=MMETSP0113_2-20130426/9293_1 /TAXON_ID=91329 /ORGANISM="Norrisiella sphaerica, Strain BC52" /LENGTH=235 /DNA_ID=CAMNT_0026869319 /DNA_START=20 /DNA_END=727 /DNA_ORIENTATION=+